jgi:hypothetical protein
MNVERIATRRAFGPAGRRECVSTHHRSITTEQRTGETGLDRRQRYPAAIDPQDAVTVEHRLDLGSRPSSTIEILDAGMQIELVGRNADPVLEVISRLRGWNTLVDEQQARHSVFS